MSRRMRHRIFAPTCHRWPTPDRVRVGMQLYQWTVIDAGCRVDLISLHFCSLLDCAWKKNYGTYFSSLRTTDPIGFVMLLTPF
ncbi:hypothetical protein [Dictyobacter arantiisoli]|uniref:hypothetical protein n=1 Tax=Dictyobacter arantiisoli TaxID=2014874 RepID=UPI0011EE6B03|nr:hypothetical protein [Dictyobacter arantiisoli]